MGKGYYTLKFHNKEDKAKAKSHLIWDLPAGSLRLRDWVRYFNPYKESSSLAQVWVRIYYLPVGFWHPEVLAGIGRWLGQPLKIDGNSMDDEVAHFARILVEIDLAQPLPETMAIDDGEYSFNIEFNYEYLPLFCTRCRITGHSVDKCRKGKRVTKAAEELVKPKEPEWHAVGKDVNKPSSSGKDVSKELENILAAEPEEQQKGARDRISLKRCVLNDLGFHDTEVGAASQQGFQQDQNVGGHQDLEVTIVQENELHSPRRNEENIHATERSAGRKDSTRQRVPSDHLEKRVAGGGHSEIELQKVSTSDGEKDVLEDTEGLTEMHVLSSGKASSEEREETNIALGNEVSMAKEDPPKHGRGRPTRQDQAARNHNKALLMQQESIKNRLRKSVEAGHRPCDFMVDYSNTDSLRAMDNVVHKQWGNEADLATEFIESPSSGLRFTWSGRRFLPRHVESLLDRAIFSSSFADLWTDINTHCRAGLDNGRRSFKFLNMWVTHPNFQEMVDSSWTGQQKLMEVQNKISILGYTNEYFDEEVEAQASLSTLLDRETIQHHIIDFFSNLFKEEGQVHVERVLLEAIIDQYVSDEQNDNLTGIPDDDEITASVFGMDANSSPGPDGFSGRFCQSCWNTIKADIFVGLELSSSTLICLLAVMPVLRVNGYHERFIRWISIIFTSARISILYNGQLSGYFACSRGVRQGDPLSPILFGIAEDVLSHLFLNCVRSKHLVPMDFSRRSLFPTHLLYADDILIFCKATVKNARKIKEILDLYGELSGQLCNPVKSHVFFGSGFLTLSRMGLLGKDFAHSILSTRYLTRFGYAKAYLASFPFWMGIQEHVNNLIDHSYSYVGTGDHTYFWRDDWLGYKLWEKLHIPPFMLDFLNQAVSHIYREGNNATDLMANQNRSEGWWPFAIDEIKDAVLGTFFEHLVLSVGWVLFGGGSSVARFAMCLVGALSSVGGIFGGVVCKGLVARLVLERHAADGGWVGQPLCLFARSRACSELGMRRSSIGCSAVPEGV
ncbi:uncharacterized protein LOC131025918 [Salvia miltiorrhiza]|uniref:uncharacterized protein LOC131025918 n=1 Tax=Salvia miltiorrhiza TaxID=226208 RepID=UPI0025ABA2A2|nr:uncharacterized protein LOC131025918 [Salvia miltiorrhiza]